MPDAEQKPRVVIAAPVSDTALEQIRALAPGYRIEKFSGDVPAAAWADTEVLFTSRQLPTAEQAPNLRWIQTASAGFDWALTQPITQDDQVMLTSASGIHATPIAEHCLGMMLALNPRLPALHTEARKTAEREDGPLAPHERGKTVALSVTQHWPRAARLCDARGMTVLPQADVRPEAPIFY